MSLDILQLNIKKRYVYGAIAFIWIVIPTLEITFSAVTTVIVQETCVLFSAYPSYAAAKTTGFLTLFIAYFLPLSVMVFCYARIVRELRVKVTICLFTLVMKLIFIES